MMEFKLFWSEEDKQHYYCGHINCNECNKALDGAIVFIDAYSKHKSEIFVTCVGCAKNLKLSGFKVISTTTALFSENIPPGSLPVILRPPEISNSKSHIDVYDAADFAKADEVVDKTKFAGRESFKGAKIGADIKKQLEEKDAAMPIGTADSFLNSMLDAQPIIEHQDKKMIGDKDKPRKLD